MKIKIFVVKNREEKLLLVALIAVIFCDFVVLFKNLISSLQNLRWGPCAVVEQEHRPQNTFFEYPNTYCIVFPSKLNIR